MLCKNYGLRVVWREKVAPPSSKSNNNLTPLKKRSLTYDQRIVAQPVWFVAF